MKRIIETISIIIVILLICGIDSIANMILA